MKIVRRIRRGRVAEAPRVRYLVAPAGHPNYGDELIARVWLARLAAQYPHDRVVLDCHTPGQAAVLLDGVHPHLLVTDTLWRVAAESAHADPQRPWEPTVARAAALGRSPHLDAGLDVLHGAHSIHLLGGGYVNALWPHHVAVVAAVAAVARAHAIPAYATGQGLSPAPGGPAGAALSAAWSAFDLVDVRDRESLAHAGPAGHLSVDDVWLGVGTASAPLEPPPGPAAPVEPGRVVLCLQSDRTDDFAADGLHGPQALAALVRRTLDHWRVPGDRVTVVEGIPGGDRVVFDLLGDRLDGARFVPFLHLWRHGLPAAAGQTWISTRFHPHLLAAAAGASGIAVVTEPDYYDVKHASLIAAGSAWTVLTDPAATPDRPAAGGFTADAVAAARAQKSAVARRVYPAG